MRISVDGRHVGAGRGVARYVDELLPRMRGLGGEWDVEARGRLANAAGALFGRPRLGVGADVVWLPAPAPVAVAGPYVLTVHDLSWVLRPQDFTPYERLWHLGGRLRRLAERARALVAVSEATRDAMVAEWGIEAARIRVIRSGPGLVPHEMPLGEAERAARPYFLVVGALEPRKDPVTAARAFAIARARGLDAELWFAGEGRLANAVAGEGVRVLGQQDDARLHELYADAIAVVHPALLEGFSFPPIEALANGTPAIVSDIPVHREILGDSAQRFAPGDPSSLAEQLLSVRPPGPAPHLDWDEAAKQTYDVLTSC
jgi:glycosyltransferase involved in cell wall biosynthesis